MCNNCDCSQDLYDRCSIIASISMGQCCHLCAGYQERFSCEYYGAKLLSQLGLTSTNPEIIKHAVSVKNKEKQETVTLIVNKDKI